MDDAAKPCHGLGLHLREDLQEQEPAQAKVSDLVNQIWQSLQIIPYSELRLVPSHLARHLGLNNNVIARPDLPSAIVNHLCSEGHENLFICKLEVEALILTLSQQQQTSEYLLQRGMRPQSYQNKSLKRSLIDAIAVGESPVKRASVTSVITRVRSSESARAGQSGILGRQLSRADSPYESLMTELRDVTEGTEDLDQDTIERSGLGILYVSHLIRIGRLDLIIKDFESISKLIDDELDKLHSGKSVKVPSSHVSNDNNSIIFQAPPPSPSHTHLTTDPCHHHRHKEISNDHTYHLTEADVKSGVFIPSLHRCVELEEVMNSSSSVICLGQDNPSSPDNSYEAVTSISLSVPDKAYKEHAIKVLGSLKDSQVNSRNLMEIIGSFPSEDVEVGKQLFIKKTSQGPLSELEEKFLDSVKIKLLYHISIADKSEKLVKSFVRYTDPSLDEIRQVENTELIKERSKDDTYFHVGPSTLTITKECVPPSILAKVKLIIIGSSELFRESHDSGVSSILGDETLNLSPPNALTYSENLSATNTLYPYLMRIVSQVGTEGPFPPLLVEFFYRNNDVDLRPSVFNFLRTLTKVQEVYQGLVMAISPPPYYVRPMDLNHYVSVKRTCIKAAETLATVGFASNIYVVIPSLVSYPIFLPEDFPLTLGFMIDYSYRKRPLFTPEGAYSPESYKRIAHSLKRELAIFRKCNIVN